MRKHPQALQNIHGIYADFGKGVTTFHNEKGRKSQRSNLFSDPDKMLAFNPELRSRIALIRINAERNDCRVRTEPLCSVKSHIQRCRPSVPTCIRRKRQIEICAFSSPYASFIRIPEKKGIIEIWVCMYRGIENVPAAVENVLRAISVMIIDVDNLDFSETAIAQILRRNSSGYSKSNSRHSDRCRHDGQAGGTMRMPTFRHWRSSWRPSMRS